MNTRHDVSPAVRRAVDCRLSTVGARIASAILVGIRFGAYLLYGAVCGLLLWGLQRWTVHRDWRVLGALLRIVCGALIGFVIWWNYVRPIDPHDPYLLQVLLQIGSCVGLFWAVVWLVFLQPPPAPRERKQSDPKPS